MKKKSIESICDELSICVSCYEKVHAYLKTFRHQCCHICFHPCPRYDFEDLRWIGDEHVICCGESSCEEAIRGCDEIRMKLDEQKLTKTKL